MDRCGCPRYLLTSFVSISIDRMPDGYELYAQMKIGSKLKRAQWPIKVLSDITSEIRKSAETKFR